MTDEDHRQAVSMARIRRAMEHIEAAQTELGMAGAELSSIIGWIPEGDKLRRLYDQVRALWYRVEAKLQKGKHLDLDHSPRPDLYESDQL